MKKGLKITLCIIAVLVVLLIIYIARNYVIISGIIDRQIEIENADNYSYTITISQNGEKQTISFEKKDGVVTEKISDGIETTLDNQNNPIIEPLKIEDTFFHKLGQSINCFISNDTVNGENVYKVEQKLWGIKGNAYYYSKEDKTIIRYSLNDGNLTTDLTWNFTEVEG